MGYPHGYETQIRFGPPLTRAVKALLLANAAAFMVQVVFFIAAPRASRAFTNLFALRPALALGGLRLWQFITYSFLHEVAGVLPWHIIFNMFLLWIFGGDVEAALGGRRFLVLYFAAAFAGGLCMIPWYHGIILGASAAVFGVMAMYARLFPYRRLLVWGVFPVRARTLVLALVALDLFFLLATGGRTSTAHLAHVGGFVVGWFFFRLEHALDEGRRRMERRRAEQAGRDDERMRRKVDELLAKVGREGLGSLTRRERQFLKRASGRFRR